MDYLKIVVFSVVSVVVLFILTKLMGNKQISQLNMFDYIVGITIGSIAAEMATELEGDPLHFIIAMSVYAFLALGISLITAKSLRARRFFSGKPMVIFDNGTIYRENLKKARMDVSDFLTYARLAGYSNLAQVKTAVLEYNGSVSFIPKGESRPATPKDLRIAVTDDLLFSSVIMDGHIIEKNLKQTDQTREWLLKELKKAGFNSVSEIFLALCDVQGNLNIYAMNYAKPIQESIE